MKVKSLFKVAGIVLAALFAVGAFASASASAAHWSVCLKANSGTTTTKWASSQCEKAETGGSWEWSELKGTERGRAISQTLELTDTKVPIIGSTTVICKSGSGEGTGIVGPGKFGRIESTKIKEPKVNCRGTGGCKAEGIEEIKAIHTPWQTELTETEGKVLGILTGGGSGEPGWEVKCENILSGKTTDVCEIEAGKGERALLINIATGTELLVLGTAEKVAKQRCTEGKAESGEIGGSAAGLLTSGAASEVSLH
jgi:hypothetical protein